jgi:hypothetical protein
MENGKTKGRIFVKRGRKRRGGTDGKGRMRERKKGKGKLWG